MKKRLQYFQVAIMGKDGTIGYYLESVSTLQAARKQAREYMHKLTVTDITYKIVKTIEYWID